MENLNNLLYSILEKITLLFMYLMVLNSRTLHSSGWTLTLRMHIPPPPFFLFFYALGPTFWNIYIRHVKMFKEYSGIFSGRIVIPVREKKYINLKSGLLCPSLLYFIFYDLSYNEKRLYLIICITKMTKNEFLHGYPEL